MMRPRAIPSGMAVGGEREAGRWRDPRVKAQPGLYRGIHEQVLRLKVRRGMGGGRAV